MLDRWIPLVAAVLGLAGGMGGAYVGGAVANHGEGQRLRDERASQVEDRRRNTYATYLMELEKHFFLGGTPEKERAAQAAGLLVSPAGIRRACPPAGHPS